VQIKCRNEEILLRCALGDNVKIHIGYLYFSYLLGLLVIFVVATVLLLYARWSAIGIIPWCRQLFDKETILQILNGDVWFVNSFFNEWVCKGYITVCLFDWLIDRLIDKCGCMKGQRSSGVAIKATALREHVDTLRPVRRLRRWRRRVVALHRPPPRPRTLPVPPTSGDRPAAAGLADDVAQLWRHCPITPRGFWGKVLHCRRVTGTRRTNGRTAAAWFSSARRTSTHGSGIIC